MSKDFIREIVDRDLAAKLHEGRVRTRFPPEPNGYLHIGHAKSICLNYGIAVERQGECNLRFDDTNPIREDEEYVQAIQADVRWLFAEGVKEQAFYASDYFERFYEFAVELINRRLAFVCDQTAQEFADGRGTPISPGTESPWRERTPDENLALFARMRAGEFPEGAKTLRARIDMASPNIHLRDPALYRIRQAVHHRTGDAWKIYPTYDFAHCLSDALEGITHSLCTLEFAVHRPLYDWILEHLPLPRPLPRQYEFARLNLSYTVLSKRKLNRLVAEKKVAGWDDPRMPTISGLRRRGGTPEAIRAFCAEIGVTRYDGLTDVALLEHCIRRDLNLRALRAMAVLRPLRVVIDNWDEVETGELEAINNPEDDSAGARTVPFSRELYIEQTDFMEDPPRKFFRLRPGGEVRLRYAFIMKCQEVEKDEAGQIRLLRCTIDPKSRRGGTTAGRRVKGTIHWVSAEHAIKAEIRLWDRLFSVPEPEKAGEGRDFLNCLNPESREVLNDSRLEPSLAEAVPGTAYQFERVGYFCRDERDSRPGAPVFNRTVSLRAPFDPRKSKK